MKKHNFIAYFVLLLFILIGFNRLCAQQSDEQLATYYYQNQEFDKAIELFEPLYSRSASQYNYQMLYNCYLQLQLYKDAEHLVEKRIKQNPKMLTLFVDLGSLYESKGESKKAAKTFDDAVQKTGFDSKQVNDLAAAFIKSGHSDYAVQTYLVSRQKTKNEFLYVMELAVVYEQMGNYEAMMQEYFNLLDKSPGSMSSIQVSLQRALNETSNPHLAEGLRNTLVSRIRQQPNNKSYLEMMIWFSIQQRDFAFALEQAKAVDIRIPDDGGEQVFRVAQIAQNNEDYVTAAAAYGYIVKKGDQAPYYIDSRVGDLRVKFLRLNRDCAISPADLTALIDEYEQALLELGKNGSTVPIMREYASLLAYHANELQEAADILYDVLEIPRLQPHVESEVKLELGDLLLFAGEVWDASLLYSQVEKANKDDVIGSLAKYKNARLSYFNNDFLWAKSQLDVLRASTSKLIANDAMELSLLISDNMEDDSTYDMLELYASADLLLYRNRLDEAWDAFDAINQRALTHPLFDEVLMQKAKIRMKQGRYAEADSLLQKLVDFYPTDITADDAVMMLAELNDEQLHNEQRAIECYEKLILDYPTSLYVERARRRYNELKKSL